MDLSLRREVWTNIVRSLIKRVMFSHFLCGLAMHFIVDSVYGRV